MTGVDTELEEQISQWRAYLQNGETIRTGDLDELESHLRDVIEGLVEAGLSADEAYLVAVKRMGNLDALSREFARAHSDRLWKQLVLAPGDGAETGEEAGWARRDLLVMIGCAVGAAAATRAPELFGVGLDTDEGFYQRNASLLALPFVAGYLAWKRQLGGVAIRWLVLLFAAGALFANVFPFTPGGSTEAITALHLPLALWFVVGYAYVGGDWRSSSRRMDFLRFTGEMAIYYALIGLGGGVLMAFTLAMFDAIGFDIEFVIGFWLLPCGAAGALVVSAWLVEAKQGVIENMAPVLTRVFSPLFALVLLAFLATTIGTWNGVDVEREVLIGFDFLLVLVIGLLLYAISARSPSEPPTVFDGVQLVLALSALVIDVVVLTAIAARISEFGFSPNKVAALGENLVLLVSLTGSAYLYVRFWLRRGTFAALERWQTAYLPVYAGWFALVVVAFPPVFGYV